MTVEQTVEIPASRQLTIDVPREVPTGTVVLAFTPVVSAPIGETRDPGDTPEYRRRKAMKDVSIEFMNRNAERLNREMEDVLKYQIDIFEVGSPFEDSDFVIPPHKDEP